MLLGWIVEHTAWAAYLGSADNIKYLPSEPIVFRYEAFVVDYFDLE